MTRAAGFRSLGAPATVGARVQAARENLGLSRRELGDIVGRSAATIGAIERDERGTGDIVGALAGALTLGDDDLTEEAVMP